MKKRIAIIAHGGAGGINYPHRRKNGLVKAVKAGHEILRQGGSALDAVETATIILEDTTIFNAGTGSYFNLVGDIEMDASVMTSELKFGAVGVIRDVKNPISVARMVMEKTDHLLLCGENAIKFARLMGVGYHNPKTREKELIWRRKKSKRQSNYFKKIKEFTDLYGTVGTVAIDQAGIIAVATSSGGINLRLPGRVGDTPVLGAGTYANRHGGASATGHGEQIMRHLIALRAVTFMSKMPVKRAAERTIGYATKSDCHCGIIGINKRGEILCTNNTRAMSWCYMKDGRLHSFSMDN